MSRSYKGVRVKAHHVYSIEDLMELYGVTANTVSNWNADGLMRSDGQKPHLYQGAAVAHFHAQRMGRQRVDLRPGEFKCMTCKAAGFPDIETVERRVFASGRSIIFAICPSCQAQIRKIPSEADCDIIEDCRNPSTSRVCLHEGNERAPGGIGISAEIESPSLHFENDRLLYRWQKYAQRHSAKTVQQHLAAIRYCEHVTRGKPFIHFTTDDACAVREDLKRRASPDAEDHLSASSIRHIVSHLRHFFEWVFKQEGYKRLPKDIPDNLQLPKAITAAAGKAPPKAYPSVQDAKDLLRAMPSRSMKDQRARAIFALAFLGGLRADTLMSLRVKHINVAERRIYQDGKVTRTKNGKSITIVWFLIPNVFAEVVTEWVDTLEGLGFEGDDALFPDLKWLQRSKVIGTKERDTIRVMTTTNAVTQAFDVACQATAHRYTPHGARHTLAAERDLRPLTRIERKAWSENLGHENEQTTVAHYGKLSEELRLDVMGNIGPGEKTSLRELADEDKIALVNNVIEALEARNTD